MIFFSFTLSKPHKQWQNYIFFFLFVNVMYKQTARWFFFLDKRLYFPSLSDFIEYSWKLQQFTINHKNPIELKSLSSLFDIDTVRAILSQKAPARRKFKACKANGWVLGLKLIFCTRSNLLYKSIYYTLH